jgi:hypothetical protein
MIHVVEGISVKSTSGKKWYDLAKKTVSQQNPWKLAAKVILRPQHSPSSKTQLESIFVVTSKSRSQNILIRDT